MTTSRRDKVAYWIANTGLRGLHQSDGRCTCYVPGGHGEKPRKRVLPAKKALGHFLPPVETDDPRCPVHGIAGRKIMRKIAQGGADEL